MTPLTTLPGETNSSMPYRVMIEINQPADPTEKLEDQPSLIYQVEVDNYDRGVSAP